MLYSLIGKKLRNDTVSVYKIQKYWDYFSFIWYSKKNSRFENYFYKNVPFYFKSSADKTNWKQVKKTDK